ncbi:MAG: GNAT family N-acetyltransferase [Gemmobacter sp.]|nr:GNAT family N-acetyltransferase [Gemmobacter sp.]
MPPILHTDRLILRPHDVDDFAAVAALWAEPEVIRHILPAPATPEESWSRLLRYMGHWQAVGYGYWVIADRDNGVFLGEAGLANYRRSMNPPLSGPEAGWVLTAGAHGRGLATEAVGAILTWADRSLTAPETCCIFDPAHDRSLRVAQKLGYDRPAMSSYKGNPTLVLRRGRALLSCP